MIWRFGLVKREVAKNSERLRLFANQCLFFCEFVFALEKDSEFVLLSDDRSPAWIPETRAKYGLVWDAAGLLEFGNREKNNILIHFESRLSVLGATVVQLGNCAIEIVENIDVLALNADTT